MGLTYKDLDTRVRELMLEEIDSDIAKGSLFLSDRLTERGKADYPLLLKNAARSGTDATLAADIRLRLNSHDKPRRLATGGFSEPPRMPSNAHTTLAEGEFNRFYIRGVCRRALELGTADIIIYRAKFVEHPRSESERKIGQRVPAETLLRDLRDNPGVDTALGLPPGPNSGLSAHLPES